MGGAGASDYRRAASPTLTNDECEWTRANLKETMPELPSPLGPSFLNNSWMPTSSDHTADWLYGAGWADVGSCYTVVPISMLPCFTRWSHSCGQTRVLDRTDGWRATDFHATGADARRARVDSRRFAIMREWRRVVREGPQTFEAMKAMAETIRSDQLPNSRP